MTRLIHILCYLLLVGTVGLTGCTSKNYAYTEFDGKFVRFQLSPEWKLRQSSGAIQIYSHPKNGDLIVTAMNPNDIQRQLNRRFSTTVIRAGDDNFGRQMSGVVNFLEPVKSEPLIAEALKCLTKIPKNVEAKDASKAATDWNEAKQSLTTASNNPGPASLLIHALTRVKLPLSKTPDPIQDLQVGVKAVRVDGQCFAGWMGYLLCIESFGPAKETDELNSMLRTLEFNCPPPEGADLPQRGQSSSHSKRSNYDLTSIGLYLMFIAGPSFLGAWTGYNSSEDQRKGAASGAFVATACGSFLATVVSVLMIVSWGANAPRGSGVMTAGVAAFIFACVALVGGLVASGLLAALASLGASQGAKRGAFMAGLSAVFFPIFLVALIVAFQWAKSMSGV